jgi:probable phosphoglycerate mutase
MKTLFYLMRHGQTDWNVRALLMGQTDIPLNDHGVLQAQQLRDRLSGVAVQAVYSSDLSRAQQTAEIVASAHDQPVVTHPELRERWYGESEGKVRTSAKARDGWVFEGDVEDLETFRGRFRNRLLEIARRHPGQTVIVVAHSGPIRHLLVQEHLASEGSEQFKTAVRNGGFAVISCDGHEFELEGVGTIDTATETHD